MCGRFVLITDLSVIARDFNVSPVSVHFSPSRNVSPGQYIPAVTGSAQGNALGSYLWGLIPFWAKDPSGGPKRINARAETLTQKPSFKNAFAKRRCLIPADGFYEWKKEGNKKIPYCFRLKGDSPFVFAGLYERWTAPDHRLVETCAIITTTANELVKPIHDRMPVMIPPEQTQDWLSPDMKDVNRLLELLKPYPAEKMQCEPAVFP